MNKHFTILAAAFAASSMSASSAVLVAGWEDFSGSTGFLPTQTSLGITASIAGTTVAATDWDQWNSANGSGLRQGASVDGTFGSFTGATANTDSEATGDNLALSRSDGELTITLTNNSGTDQDMDGFHFDGVRKNNNGATTWALSFGGAISGAAITGQSLDTVSSMPAASAAQRDKSIDLSTALSDSVWEAGQDITFTLTFTGSTNEGTSNGNELLLDNIGVSVVPEPSSLLLGLLGTGFFFLRRRR